MAMRMIMRQMLSSEALALQLEHGAMMMATLTAGLALDGSTAGRRTDQQVQVGTIVLQLLAKPALPIRLVCPSLGSTLALARLVVVLRAQVLLAWVFCELWLP